MKKVILFVSSIWFLSCSTNKKLQLMQIDGIEYVSVKSYGALGNGKNDDVNALQSAINNHSNIYIPEGKYLLGHPQYNTTNNPFALLIDPSTKCRNIYFEDGAEFFISDNFGKPGEKYSTILIKTENVDLQEVIIDGITINSNNTKNQYISGIHAIESKGNIKKLIIKNATIKNLSGGGINTFALKNYFYNIYTENLGGHGIGAANPYNLNQEHYLEIDGYTSIHDQAYSIDFSGASTGEGGKLAQEGDIWTADVKNVVSKASKNGIKTAGHWNLKMDSILIEGSLYNGFFLSKDAPNRTVNISNMVVRDCRESGVFLAGKSSFIGNNITIENCKSGFYVDFTKVKVNGLTVDGKNKNSIGIRVQNNAEISNFKVTGLGNDYPVWVTGTNCIFKNGIIYNNEGPYSFLVHENADNVILEDIEFYDNRQQPKQIYGYMILQKSGNLTIRNKNRSAKPQIENRSGIRILE